MIVVSLAALVTETFLIRPRPARGRDRSRGPRGRGGGGRSSRPCCGGSARTCEAAEGRRDRQSRTRSFTRSPGCRSAGCWRPARTGSSSPRCVMRPGSATRCCRNSPACSKTPGTWKSARARSAGGRARGSGSPRKAARRWRVIWPGWPSWRRRSPPAIMVGAPENPGRPGPRPQDRRGDRRARHHPGRRRDQHHRHRGPDH